MRELLKEMFASLFSDPDHTIEFVTWTGENNSFIVKKDGKEFRVEVSEEEEGGFNGKFKAYNQF